MSDNAPKSVTVTVPINTVRDDVTHPEAVAISVNEGHLEVKKSVGSQGQTKTIALYAPGKWVSAVINY